MTHDNERDNTLRGEMNFIFAEAKDWLSRHWDWLTDEQIEKVKESPEALKKLVIENLGEADGEMEWERFIAMFPDYLRMANAESRHGPIGPIDDRELDQRQRGPGAE